MSLLINESYANTGKPLWASANGGSIDGNLVVNGSISTLPLGIQSITTGGSYITKPNGVIAGVMGYDLAGDLVLACQGGGNSIVFTQLGSTGNSSFTPSAQGANLDSFSVGGTVYGDTVQTTDLQLSASAPASAICGTSTLVAGQSPVINTTACLGPTTKIFLQRTDVNASTSLGELRVRQRNAGNFLVESDVPATPGIPDPNDVSTFDWMIVNVF